MWSVVTLIQYLLFEPSHYRDAHPIVEPYCTTLIDHKSRCFSHQYFLPNSLQLWGCSLGYTDLLYRGQLCLHRMKDKVGSRGDYVEF